MRNSFLIFLQLFFSQLIFSQRFSVRNWNKLQKDLQGKIRVSVGNQDNFSLNSAVHLLENEMKDLNTGFVFAYYAGDHFTVFTTDYRKTGDYFLIEKYLQWQKENKVK